MKMSKHGLDTSPVLHKNNLLQLIVHNILFVVSFSK